MIGPSEWLALVLCLAGNVVSSLGFKQFAERATLELSWENALTIATNVYAWMGVGGGLTFLIGYIMLLRTVPISVAFPMTVSLGTMGIVLAGVFLLGEHLRPMSGIGIGLILVGVYLVSQ